MKQLLCAHTSHRQDLIVEHTFFVTDEHCTRLWDGRSPLDIQIEQVITTATNYVQRVTSHTPKFQRLEFSVQSLKTGDRYYYFLVVFERPWWDDPDAEIAGIAEAIVTLDYKVIEPEIHQFNTEAEYQKYRVLQRLNHQLGSINVALEQQVACLSTNLLWNLEAALWNFTCETDLADWLEAHNSRKRKTRR